MLARRGYHLPIDVLDCLAQLGYIPHQRRDNTALSRVKATLILDWKTELVYDKNTGDFGWTRTIETQGRRLG